MFFFACPPQSTPITPPQELKRAKHRSYHLDAQTGIVVKGKINPLGCSPPETWKCKSCKNANPLNRLHCLRCQQAKQAEVVHVDSLEEAQHLAVIAVSAMET